MPVLHEKQQQLEAMLSPGRISREASQAVLGSRPVCEPSRSTEAEPSRKGGGSGSRHPYGAAWLPGLPPTPILPPEQSRAIRPGWSGLVTAGSRAISMALGYHL